MMTILRRRATSLCRAVSALQGRLDARQWDGPDKRVSGALPGRRRRGRRHRGGGRKGTAAWLRWQAGSDAGPERKVVESVGWRGGVYKYASGSLPRRAGGCRALESVLTCHDSDQRRRRLSMGDAITRLSGFLPHPGPLPSSRVALATAKTGA